MAESLNCLRGEEARGRRPLQKGRAAHLGRRGGDGEHVVSPVLRRYGAECSTGRGGRVNRRVRATCQIARPKAAFQQPEPHVASPFHYTRVAERDAKNRNKIGTYVPTQLSHPYYTEGMTNLHPHQRLSSACHHDGVHLAAASLLSTMSLVSLAGGGRLPASRRQRQVLAAPTGCLASHNRHTRASLPYSRCPCRRLHDRLGV